ncbi:MAG: zinc ribbon domain-containing protein [Dehalococcoidia bacterium]
MALQGYECNRCKASFEEIKPSQYLDYEIKCPYCGSTDVTESDAAAEYLELIREYGRTGG